MKTLARTILSLGTILLLFSGSGLCDAGRSLEEKFNSANDAYVEGRYQEAITAYRKMIGEHGFSPELLHNLGNSYAAAGHYGQAVLQYMRGLRLAPGDDDLQGDLALIREKTGLFQEERSPGERFVALLDMNQWALLALYGYIALALLLTITLRFPLKKGLLPLGFLLTGLIIISSFAAYRQHALWSGGVVTNSETRLLLSPFDSASSLGSIDEGAIIHSEKRHGDYHYIRDGKGRSGWIPTASFEPIVTRHVTYSQDDAGQ
jgi:hypothetical protein